MMTIQIILVLLFWLPGAEW